MSTEANAPKGKEQEFLKRNEVSKVQIKELLQRIRKESVGLTAAMWAPEELIENKYNLRVLNQTINTMINMIPRSLYFYEKIDWKKTVPNRGEIEEIELQKQMQKEKERLNNYVQKSDFYVVCKNQVSEIKMFEKLSQYGYHDLHQKDVLDIGCGDGHWLRKFMEWGAKPERLIGIEIHEQLLEHAKKHSKPPLQFLKAYPEQLPFEDYKFNIVLLFGFMMHILNDTLRRKTGQEVLRVLSNDGIIITSNLLAGVEQQLDPFLAYTTKGLSLEDLQDIFPDCQVAFEQLSPYGLAVIRRKNLTKEKGVHPHAESNS